MAYITTNDLPGALRARFSSLFSRLGTALVAYAERRSRRDQIERLNALSDAELAARGLSRDQIIAHVFRDRLLIM